MAELVSGDVNSSNNSPEPPKKFNFLPLIALCAIVVVLVGIGIIAIQANRGPDVDYPIETETTPISEEVDEEVDESMDVEPEEEPTQPVPITGETLDITQDGIHLALQPKDLLLTTEQPFGVSLTIEVMDDINPEVAEIRVPILSDKIRYSTGQMSDKRMKYNENWEASSDAISVEDDYDAYIITKFKPGDTVTFTIYGTCPYNADLHEAETISSEILENKAPEKVSENVEVYDWPVSTIDFDYTVTIQNAEGETSGDPLRYGEAAEKGIEVEEYTPETRQAINEALDEARAQTTDINERASLFTDAVINMSLTAQFEGLDGDILKMRTFNGYVLEINLSPEHDGEPVFDY